MKNYLMCPVCGKVSAISEYSSWSKRVTTVQHYKPTGNLVLVPTEDLKTDYIVVHNQHKLPEGYDLIDFSFAVDSSGKVQNLGKYWKHRLWHYNEEGCFYYDEEGDFKYCVSPYMYKGKSMCMVYVTYIGKDRDWYSFYSLGRDIYSYDWTDTIVSLHKITLQEFNHRNRSGSYYA